MDAVRKSEAAVDEYLSVPRAAKRLGKAHSTVLQLVIRGDLRGKIVAGRTVIECASVEEYEARAAQPENAPV